MSIGRNARTCIHTVHTDVHTYMHTLYKYVYVLVYPVQFLLDFQVQYDNNDVDITAAVFFLKHFLASQLSISVYANSKL